MILFFTFISVRKRHTNLPFMRTLLKLCSIIILICNTSYLVRAQGTSHYLNYTVQDGLPSNLVYTILEDNEGYIYVGTDKGLCKFDGHSFECFGIKDGLPNLEVLGLYQGTEERIWISTFSKQPIYLENGKLHFLETIPKKRTPSIFSYGFINPDTLVAYTRSHAHYFNCETLAYLRTIKLNPGLLGMRNTLATYSFINNNRRINMRLNNTHLLYYDPMFGFCVVSPNILGPRTMFQFQELHTYHKKYGPFKKGHCIENDSLIFARSPNGLFTFNLNKKRFSKVYLEHADIFGLERDRKNRLWVGTNNNGLYVIENNLLQSEQYASKDSKLDGVHLIKDDPMSKSSIIVFNKKSEFLYMDQQNDSIETISEIPESYKFVSDFTIRDFKPHLMIVSSILYRLGPNSVWKEIEKFVQGDIPKKIVEIDPDRFYVFTHRILRFEKDECVDTIIYSPDVRTYCVEHLNDSIIMVGTLAGMHFFKHGTSNSTNYIQQSILNEPISDILKIEKNMFCVSSETFGINCYKYKENEVIELGNWQPIDDIIKHLSLDDGTILALANKGLYRLSIPQLEFQDYISVNGHQSIQYIAKKNGELIVFGKNRVQSYNQKVTSQEELAKLHVMNVSFNNVTVDPSKLSSFQTNLDIKLSIPYFSQKPPSIHYKLEGTDENDFITNDRVIRLRNLPSGSYSFSAQAFIGARPISQRVTLPINLPPVFWKNWWFITLVILFFTGILYYYFLQSRNRQKARTDLLQQRLNALHAQMNPHFIFNALQSLQYYINKNDKTKANTYLTTFANLVRRTLESSSNDYILIEDEVDYLTSFLEMEKEKLDGHLSYSIDYVQEELEAISIPSMILQPFVENAAIHAFKPGDTNRQIHISFSKTNKSELLCRVSDNGNGILANSTLKGHKSFASNAVKNKLNLINQIHTQRARSTDVGVRIFDHTKEAHETFNSGTTVEIILPIIIEQQL